MVPPESSLFDFDAWVSKANAAWAILGALVTGAGGMYLRLRSKLSKLSTQLTTDRIEERRITMDANMQSGWYHGILTDRESLAKRNAELEDRIESLREKELSDGKQISRLETLLNAQNERLADMAEEAARMITAAAERESKIGACEERIRAAADERLAANMYIEKLSFALVKADPAAAERIFHERWDKPKILTSQPGPEQ